MNKPKNRNEMMQFLKEKRTFYILFEGKRFPVVRVLFGLQKEIIRTLSNIPESKFSSIKKMEVRATLLCDYLNGKRINSHYGALLFKKELMLAIKFRLKDELSIDELQCSPIYAEFERIYDKLYIQEMSEKKSHFYDEVGLKKQSVPLQT